MSKIDDLINEIIVYEKKYRNQDMKPYGKGVYYDLKPDLPTDLVVEAKWPAKWPHLNDAGIYAFISENLEILYIGKASNNNGLGYRIDSYVSYDKNRDCKLNDQWKGEPRFVFIFAVPSDSRFEAPALEEYLISKIRTRNNKIGTQSMATSAI